MEDFLGSPRSGGKPPPPPRIEEVSRDRLFPPLLDSPCRAWCSLHASTPLLLSPCCRQVEGRWVLKNFRDEVTGVVRPFRGQVKRRFKSDGRWVLGSSDAKLVRLND